MQTSQEQTAVRLEVLRPTMERLAAGDPVDEGERSTDWEGLHPVMNRYAEDRELRVEWDADARLWLIENPDDSVPREYAASMQAIVREARRRKDYVALQQIAANFEDPEWVPRSINPADAPEYAPRADARDLKTADFYEEVIAGAAALVTGGWHRHEYPEREYMRRKAEAEAKWSRSESAERGADKSQKEIEFDRAFNKFQKRFHEQRKKRMAKSRSRSYR